MINRELIRLKVVQLVYSNYKNPGKTLEKAVEELSFSLAQSYDLYHYLLLLIPEITDFGRELYESSYSRMKSLGESETPNPRFINNRFAAQLAANSQLNKFADKKGTHHWQEEEGELRALFKIISSSEIYADYMNSEEDSYEADKAFWKKVYKKYICENESIESCLEEWSIYWNDDKYIIDTFVLKTISHFKETNGADQPLLAAYDKAEDWEFAQNLFKSALLNKAEYEKLIMVTALAEIINFPQIGLSITFNEYINLIKAYSTPQNASYVNGLLDNIVKKLTKENKLIKQ